MNRHLFEGLATLDREFRHVPALAERWESPDERTWVFHLRPGSGSPTGGGSGRRTWPPPEREPEAAVRHRGLPPRRGVRPCPRRLHRGGAHRVPVSHVASPTCRWASCCRRTCWTGPPSLPWARGPTRWTAGWRGGSWCSRPTRTITARAHLPEGAPHRGAGRGRAGAAPPRRPGPRDRQRAAGRASPPAGPAPRAGGLRAQPARVSWPSAWTAGRSPIPGCGRPWTRHRPERAPAPRAWTGRARWPRSSCLPRVFGYDAKLAAPATDRAAARRLLAAAGYPDGLRGPAGRPQHAT